MSDPKDNSSDSEDIPSDIEDDPRYCTGTLAQSRFLQDAGYKLTFSDWPQLFTILRNAKRDSAACEALFDWLSTRAAELYSRREDPANTPQEVYALALVSTNIYKVVLKVQACLYTMTRVNLKALKQVVAFDTQARTSGPVFEGDSILVPGQRITFNHDPDELREGHKASRDVSLAQSL